MQQIIVNNQRDIEESVAKILKDKAIINVGLSGGRSIVPIIKSLKKINPKGLLRLRFFLVDERLERDLNQTHLMQSGLQDLTDKNRLSDDQFFFPRITENFDKDFREYDKMMKNNPLDIVFLGVGEDSHIASVFPKSKELELEKTTSRLSKSPKMPKNRITLTMKAIEKVKIKILLFFSKEKKRALENYRKNDKNKKFPASFIKGKEVIIITDIR